MGACQGMSALMMALQIVSSLRIHGAVAAPGLARRMQPAVQVPLGCVDADDCSYGHDVLHSPYLNVPSPGAKSRTTQPCNTGAYPHNCSG